MSEQGDWAATFVPGRGSLDGLERREPASGKAGVYFVAGSAVKCLPPGSDHTTEMWTPPTRLGCAQTEDLPGV